MKKYSRKKKTIEEIKIEFLKYNFILLSSEYINAKSKLKFKCHCGNISYTTYDRIKSGKAKHCDKCIKNKKLTYKYIKNLFNKNGCTLISKEYKNATSELNFICSCGNKDTTTYKKFIKSPKCELCKLTKWNLQKAKDLFKSNKCELLEKKYLSSSTSMEYRCSCGNISHITLNSFVKSSFHCKKCFNKYRENYNHALSDEERFLKRMTREFRIWRKNIYKKFNYTCQKCGQYGGKLRAHHIKSFNDNCDLALDDNNGICLCEACHVLFHKTYGYGNNNEIQLNSFLQKL